MLDWLGFPLVTFRAGQVIAALLWFGWLIWEAYQAGKRHGYWNALIEADRQAIDYVQMRLQEREAEEAEDGPHV